MALASANQDRLRTHFSSGPENTHNNRWDELWREASFLPWDRTHANPALIDLLTTRTQPLASSDPNPSLGAPAPSSASPGYSTLPSALTLDGKRRRVLVPGCGKGYDVALFAAHGYDAYGLEVSVHAAEAARKYLTSEGTGPGPLEGEYKFLCALPLSLRPKWAARMRGLLRRPASSKQRNTGGVLICLEFPTHKPASSGGPPWSLPPLVHDELLKRPGQDIVYGEDGVVQKSDREESEDALVKVAHYTPKRTHEVGIIKGVIRDCVSMWRHKADCAEGERLR
ncbi:hypothetical protein BDW02DRAFT_595317 [Decorospora gaudefroyi]|uniref:S-adenosyl-L-methionine-dependent methyltransferase n=1 Tax=Decorospora gaudefroyi TaxID=184978 RepID=A0A6A5KRJ5_9PLEO|nr:hypothetical protein BDW02DRAFT_595317 [Decorospora gaudefroyi]